MTQKIRVGIFGAGRGECLARGAAAVGMEVVAVCDRDEAMLKKFRNAFPTATPYRDYGKMLEHDLDAVILANYATEHCDAAIQALHSGRHVMSECMAVGTMAEGVRLAEAVEQSGRVYFLAENYPFFATNLEMKRLYDTGELGEFRYGEGEYIHPMSPEEMAIYTPGPTHWRNWIPPVYYCTHSMGPIMYITGTRPVKVNGFMVPYDMDDPIQTHSLRRSDIGGILMCEMSNGAIAKIIPWANFRDHGNRYRICCNRGTMETNQGDGMLRVTRPEFDHTPSTVPLMKYTPNFPPEHAEALRHGHGGGDYFTSWHFKQAIERGCATLQDVYQALDMTVIGILGYRSILNNNCAIAIPDFRDPVAREAYRHDHWTPDPACAAPGMPKPSVRGDIEISPEVIQECRLRREEYLKTLA